MRRKRNALVFSAVLFVACTPAPPERQVINDAADAMGGLDRIQSVNTLVIEGSGLNYNLGQNMSPEVDLPVFDVTDLKRAYDFAGGRWRQEQSRTAKFPTATPTTRQIAALDGDVAFNVAPTGAATRTMGQVARDRRIELHHYPVALLRAAAAEGATLANPRQEGGQSLVDITDANGDRYTLHIDAASKLPTKIVSQGYNVNLGDVSIETDLSDYQDVDGLKLPGRIVSRIDRYTVADVKVAKSVVNADTGDLAAPADVRSASDAVPAAKVDVEELGRGIWYLAGQSHHSVLVEFADHLTLIEAPQNDTRALAVIARAREIKPDKPLKYVVNTHHHFDHSGGVRAAVSEGLIVVTHERNKAFYEEVVARKHTVVADALARNPKPLAIETVGEKYVLTDGKRSVELYNVAGNPHADTLLMAYFPAERLLVEADVYTPPAPNATTMPAFPFAGNLMENVEKLKLRVDRIVPIHGRVVPMKDMMTHVKPTE